MTFEEVLDQASKLLSVGPTGQPISVHRFAAFLIGHWPVPPRVRQVHG